MRCLPFVALLLASLPCSAAEPVLSDAELRPVIEPSLKLLTLAAKGHLDARDCFACHNQGLTVMALVKARSRGFAVDEEEISLQAEAIAAFLDSNRRKYREGAGQGGQADMAGYALVTLQAAGWQPDETTEAVAEYLLFRHKDRDHWLGGTRRPPSEGSPFTTTYVSLAGLAAYGTADQQERIVARRTQVLEWLRQAEPKETEDRVFRLKALQAAGASAEDLQQAAQALLAQQRPDGGWSQLDSGEPEHATRSDAYATGTALVALCEAGGLPATDPAYERGLRWLLQSRQPDGSWHVVSRSKPFQKYFESGFPHGNDQFLSCAATAWAVMALLERCDLR